MEVAKENLSSNEPNSNIHSWDSGFDNCQPLLISYERFVTGSHDMPWTYSTFASLLAAFTLLASLIFCLWARAKSRKRGLHPYLAKPLVIGEKELCKESIISGDFGNVYKGVWTPEFEYDKIDVAIKVLEASTGASTMWEVLDETYLISSVDHPNLLRLLAVCLAPQIMLVTQLVPHGSLLEFVRSNRNNIDAKLMLNWCTQIARGMEYLEGNGLVHRNLAAHNVLVQTKEHVVISDFGLAKLRDINYDTQFRWLAPECVLRREFTHKTDVWAFGVTMWEVLTYGAVPYEDASARNYYPEVMQMCKRLAQPAICTIEAYTVMMKCWLIDPELRPSFKELAYEIFTMFRYPGRYLNITTKRTEVFHPTQSSNRKKEEGQGLRKE